MTLVARCAPVRVEKLAQRIAILSRQQLAAAEHEHERPAGGVLVAQGGQELEGLLGAARGSKVAVVVVRGGGGGQAASSKLPSVCAASAHPASPARPPTHPPTDCMRSKLWGSGATAAPHAAAAALLQCSPAAPAQPQTAPAAARRASTCKDDRRHGHGNNMQTRSTPPPLVLVSPALAADVKASLHQLARLAPTLHAHEHLRSSSSSNDRVAAQHWQRCHQACRGAPALLVAATGRVAPRAAGLAGPAPQCPPHPRLHVAHTCERPRDDHPTPGPPAPSLSVMPCCCSSASTRASSSRMCALRLSYPEYPTNTPPSCAARGCAP